MPTGTGLPLCHEYICRGASCQEHCGIMFLMAIPVALCLRNSGSQTPDCWLKLDRNTQVRQCTVVRVSAGMHLIRFENGGGIQVKGHRLFISQEEAENSVPGVKKAVEKRSGYRLPYDYMH